MFLKTDILYDFDTLNIIAIAITVLTSFIS